MAADKLSIIAGELAQTGDNIPAAADNGSDEWTVCSPAYDSAVAETIEGHSWNFDTNITALVRQGDSPDEVYARVRAAIFCGLHEDPQTGLMWEKRADQFLAEARTRVDQESPKRAMFNSRARASRYTRRPFVSSPMAWTGTGDNN
jgi:hypothetical protein